VCVLETEEANATEQADTFRPGRRTVAACFGGFAVYAGLVAVFTGHADRAWAVWAFGGYAIAALLLRFGRTWFLPLAAAVGGGLVAPMLWLVTQQPATAEVVVIGRSAKHLLKYGTPYLPPSQLSDWKAYNPYLPVMELFGLPRSAGLTGILGDPRIWLTVATAVLLAVSFAIVMPHRLRDCAECRKHTATLTAIALASPVFGFPLALGITDPPVIALLCLALAWAYRAQWVRAGLVLAVACAMKSTAWAAVPVLAVLAWVRYAPRAAARFTVTTVAATGLLSLLAAPEAMAQPAAVMQNTVDFPLGLTRHKTPAESPLPGHLMATLGPGGHMAAVMLMAVAAAAFAAWLLLRPPRTALVAGWRLAVGYAVMFVLDPASRFGYFVYPLGLLGWVAFTALSSERIVAALPFPLPSWQFRRPSA
jgi:glycosyl transferase family 87